jgi:hypothetical protein
MGNMVILGFFLDKVLNDKSWQQTIIYRINVANFTGSKEDWRKVGLYVGYFVGDLIGFRIPGYEYIYGQSMFRDLFVK